MKINNMKILIVGFGDVGSALHKIIKVSGICGKSGLQIFDPFIDFHPMDKEFDIMHICIPHNDKFVRNFLTITESFRSKVVIIESTIPIDCFDNVELKENMEKSSLWIYSPVRGTHPNIVTGLKHFVKFGAPIFLTQWISFNVFVVNYYRSIDIPFKPCSDYKALILGKILSTTWYGMLIAFCNMTNKICTDNKISFRESYNNWMSTDEIGENYIKGNKNGRASAIKNIKRPVMTPGKIGGHCVMPNLEMIKEYMPEFYLWIKKFSK